MIAPLKGLCIAGCLLGAGILFSGCEGPYDSGPPGPVVYGEVGYSVPWYYPNSWVGRNAYYSHPPFNRGSGDRPGPSLPSRPRPSGGGGGAAHSGGGGAPHGGGGSPPRGGGGGEKKHP